MHITQKETEGNRSHLQLHQSQHERPRSDILQWSLQEPE